MVKGNKSPTGNINKFELAAEYLTPWGSFTKNHNTNRKSDAAEISDASDRGKKYQQQEESKEKDLQAWNFVTIITMN